ncbi:MAG: rod shape-determining protein RodA [Alphaproteobacteria bacterium]|nr:rod shape-determining protein RodA [Alphaproteobacteria bacterium]
MKLDKEVSVFNKFLSLKWGFVLLISCVACIGFAALYSAAGGEFSPWASRQAVRFLFGMGLLIFIALTDIRFWLRLSYPLYILGFLLLIIVEIMGQVGMGAQRWINLGFIQLQPSELMKITVIMALAKYFHTATAENIANIKFLAVGSLFIIAPVALVLLQPDLGTSLMIVLAGVAVFFFVGAPLWIFISGAVLSLASLPIAWFLMHDYQKRRVLTFLNPESDPLGAGYHITQSKIALGSGGLSGKGFLEGTQSRLDFLPEKQTDFIFTLWAEEWGLLGGLLLLFLFGLIFLYSLRIALRCRHAYGQILAMGLSINFSLYVFINIAMVMGLIPVVGAPLPLISYGGTSMLAALIGFGLILCCDLHKDAKLPRMHVTRSSF